MNRPTVLSPTQPLTLAPGSRAGRSRATERTRVESRRRRGKALVVAGWISALAGIVLYCAASFGGEADADLAAVLLRGAIPGARAALAIIGCGTLLWILGAVLHTGAVLDEADLDARDRREGGTP